MKKIFYILIILFACGMLSCVDNFEDINSDPHASEVTPDPLFSRTLMCIVSSKDQVWHYDLGFCASAVQHLAGAWDSSTGGQYRPVDATYFNDVWDIYFIIGINNINAVIELTEDDDKYHNLHWAARVWRVYMFSRLTDIYGDIPYFEASKGYSDQNFSPHFDTQAEIYDDLFNELDLAATNFDVNGLDIQGDLFYNGDVTSWMRFANSLRLRLGLRLWSKDPTEAETQVRAAITGGVFESNSDNCAIPYGNYESASGEFRGNAIGQLYAESDRSQGMAGFRLTNTLVDYMKTTSDPRLLYYGRMYDYSSSTNYVDITSWFDVFPDFLKGIPQGNFWWSDADLEPGYEGWGYSYGPGELSGGPADGYWHDYGARYLMPSAYFAQPENPYQVMTYAEVELLLAEAAVHAWGATDAVTHFENGVRAYCDLIPDALTGAPNIDSDEVDALIAALTFPATTSAQLELINTQLWVGHYLDPMEAYANWRRSGYPVLTPYAGAADGSGYPGETLIPRRSKYPNYIELYNPESYAEAINRTPLSGTDDWTQSVWWDVN